MYFATLALELSFGVALETLAGTVWAQHGPKYKSRGLCLAAHFPKSALELLFGVALETLAGTVWAQHGSK